LNVIFQVYFLVLGVGPIITGPYGQQDDVLPSHLLQGQGDGDGAAFAGKVGIDSPNHLKRKNNKRLVVCLSVSLCLSLSLSHSLSLLNESDGDRAPLAGQVWVNSPNHLK
jgi:hypothetical protein